MSKSVLLLSAYDAVSHRLWRDRLCASFPDWQWTCLGLPPRHFAWRIRSNGMQWAYQERKVLERHYDLLIATSMVDLATLRGLCPKLAGIPSIVYFHENQFAYPAGRQRPDNLEPLLVPIYSALCADKIVFNSAYNRRSFLRGVDSLSRSLPEPFPPQAREQLEAAEVIPVALPAMPVAARNSNKSAWLGVLWNHRWEYDKGPALLLAVIRACMEQQLRIRFHIVGQQFRNQPSEFNEIDKLLAQYCQQQNIPRGQFGFLPEEEYRALLFESDVVLSTALHDFQGLAIQEACQAGCTPLAPNDLAYPEYLAEEFLYQRNEDDDSTAASVAKKLAQLGRQKQGRHELPTVNLAAYGQDEVKVRYESLFGDMAVI